MFKILIVSYNMMNFNGMGLGGNLEKVQLHFVSFHLARVLSILTLFLRAANLTDGSLCEEFANLDLAGTCYQRQRVLAIE